MVRAPPALGSTSVSRRRRCSRHQSRALSPSQGSTPHASSRRRSSSALWGRASGFFSRQGPTIDSSSADTVATRFLQRAEGGEGRREQHEEAHDFPKQRDPLLEKCARLLFVLEASRRFFDEHEAALRSLSAFRAARGRTTSGEWARSERVPVWRARRLARHYPP
jgi:hypothetical protein